MAFPTQPPAAQPASLFPALGPFGSVVTSIVMTAAAAAAGWLASKGYIQGTDQATVTTLIISLIATAGGIAYKAVTARMAAKVAAVQAADPKVLADAVHAVDPATLIKAVNAGDNGVKVVSANSLSPQVDRPLK